MYKDRDLNSLIEHFNRDKSYFNIENNVDSDMFDLFKSLLDNYYKNNMKKYQNDIDEATSLYSAKEFLYDIESLINKYYIAIKGDSEATKKEKSSLYKWLLVSWAVLNEE